MIRVLVPLLAAAALSAQQPETRPVPQRLDIEILYLDMTECTRCVDAGSRLDEALALLGPVLKETGWDAEVRKIHVTTEDQARALRFASSPTVRINGRDVQLDGRETPCADCGKLCKDAKVSCREWRFRDQWFTSPPKALFVEAVLGAMRAGAAMPQASGAAPFEVPENLKRFFATKTKPESRPSCCAGAAAEKSGCCESRPSAAKDDDDGCCAGGGAEASHHEAAKPSTPACTLAPESRAQRESAIQQLLRDVVERRDRENGIALRFKPEPGAVARLAGLVDLERQCCGFLTFQIRVEEKTGAVWLEVSGPASAKPTIDAYFGRK